ncbi:MAG: hypothetical protein WKF77_05465 [Planctomycetaceae bacterium]
MLPRPFDNATVPGEYLGHECPGYRNLSKSLALRHTPSQGLSQFFETIRFGGGSRFKTMLEIA